jgi:hypothetical protein
MSGGVGMGVVGNGGVGGRVSENFQVKEMGDGIFDYRTFGLLYPWTWQEIRIIKLSYFHIRSSQSLY